MSAAERESGLYFCRDFSAEEFRARRARVKEAIGDGLLVLGSAPESTGFVPVRQDNDFYYLAGLDVPHAYLTIDGTTGLCVLYLPPRNEKLEKSDGPIWSADDGDIARKLIGIDEIRPTEALRNDLVGLKRTLWVARAPAENAGECQDTLRHAHRAALADPLDGRLSRETHLMARLGQWSPLAEFKDVSPLLQRMRAYKSSAEQAVMRIAGKLCAQACLEAMKATRPGVYEFQLGAIADYIFKANGAQGYGYRPIIAGGANISMMHYWRCNTPLRDGDLVIYDYAPDYNNYTSDIGRMWPVNGRYSPLQRELYGFVLACHEVLMQVLRAGIAKSDAMGAFAREMKPKVDAWKWSKPIYREAAERVLKSPRPLSHGVGMAVHDPYDWSSEPIQPGLMVAVDPELFIPEENLYIRVEDTVLVTENGIENLTAGCPREMDEVEAIVGRGGMLEAFPPFHTNPSR